LGYGGLALGQVLPGLPLRILSASAVRAFPGSGKKLSSERQDGLLQANLGVRITSFKTLKLPLMRLTYPPAAGPFVDANRQNDDQTNDCGLPERRDAQQHQPIAQYTHDQHADQGAQHGAFAAS
jgi:hypothetical protein